MSPSNRVEFDRNSGVLDAEQTLKMVATLPAPKGLEERVKARLQSAPRQTTLIAWPFWATDGARWMQSAGVRGIAAAAIALLVVGGGWEVYSHIRVAQAPSAVAAPPALNGARNFSTAGARRVPQTVTGPVIPAPANSKQKQDAAPQKPSRNRKVIAVPAESAR